MDDPRSTTSCLAAELSPLGGPEIRLLLACARNRLDSETIEKIKTILAEEEIDWTLAVRLAIAHGLTPLLAWNLARSCSDTLPVELADALRGCLDQNRARNIELAHEALRIVDLLHTHDIPVIPIKGPTLAKTLFGDLALRPSGDLDFLVPQRHIAASLDLLRGSGYQLSLALGPGQDAAYRRYYPDYGLERTDPAISVEVHWNLAPPILAVRFDINGLWERAGAIPFEGRRVPSLSSEDYLIFLCVHGSKHLWGRLNWICDVHEFLSAYPAIDWKCCLDLARKQGCLRMLLVGLRLAEILFEVELPEAVRDRIRTDAKTKQLAEQIEADLLSNGGRQPNVFEVFRPFLPLRERFRDKFLYCWRNVTTPRVNHFGIVSLPRYLWFLYVPIKLLYDYGWRPLMRSPRKDPRAAI